MIVYVASTAPYAGKTLTLIGLGQAIKEKKKLFYLKTLGNRPLEKEGIICDEDALLVAQALDLKIKPEDLCLLVLTQDIMVEALKGKKREILKEIHDHLARRDDYEVALLSGFGTLYSGKFLGASNLDLILELKARTILVTRFEGEFVIDYLLKAREELKRNLAGIIINAIPLETRPFYEDLVRPFLEREGFKILAEIPHEPLLQAVSVGELRDFLAARALVLKREDQLIERFYIGGMQVDKAISYFKQSPNFGVIVGGDRSDIQLAAIESGAICLVLTGNLYPNDIILSKAEEAGVSILVVSDDTYSTAQKIEKLPILTRLRHPVKLKLACELMKRHLRQDLLWELLGGGDEK